MLQKANPEPTRPPSTTSAVLQPPLESRRLRSVLSRNPMLRIFAPWMRFPGVSFAGILLGWCLVLTLVNYWDGALSTIPSPVGQPSRYPFEFLGFSQDIFMWVLPLAMLLMYWGFRRFVAAVFELMGSFRDLLNMPRTDKTRRRYRESLQPIWDAIYRRHRPNLSMGARTKSPIVIERWFIVGGILLVVIFQGVIVFAGLQPPVWGMDPHGHPRAYVAACIWCLYVFALVGGSVAFRVGLISYRLFRTVRQYAAANQLIVVPIAPDGRGGLMPIGRVAIAITYVLIGPMLMVPVWLLQYGADVPGIAGGTVCVLIAVAAFFLPLQSTHRAMARARTNELKRVSRLFQEQYEKLPTEHQVGGMDGSQARELQDRLELMSKLDAVYQTVKAMPVWPFDVQTLVRFAIVVMPPVLASLLTQPLRQLWTGIEPGGELLKFLSEILGGK